MRGKLNNKSGFTLLEIIIVIIIIGVLASLALPKLFKTVEYSRSSEALSNLVALRGGVDRCFTSQGDYSKCTNPGVDLDVDNPNLVAGRLFDYTITNNGATAGYAIEAKRNATQYSGQNPNSLITLTYDAATQGTTKAGTGDFVNIK
jgi:prepilin-type N-terminal cleavage/methylation domain-containing protein